MITSSDASSGKAIYSDDPAVVFPIPGNGVSDWPYELFWSFFQMIYSSLP
jgi:hypothetical protein